MAKTDVKAGARHRAAEVGGTLRGKARTAIGKARGAKEKVAGHGPVTQATSGARVYSAAAVAAAALLLAWLTVRRRRR